ncbi:hypothetical protein HPB47_022949, partial [Ixodes persulcatus]
TQYCLENLFSIVRQRKSAPSPFELKCALCIISVSQFMHRLKTSGYTVSDPTSGRAALQEAAAMEEEYTIDDFHVMITKVEGHILG